jgi:hypothetical protein
VDPPELHTEEPICEERATTHSRRSEVLARRDSSPRSQPGKPIDDDLPNWSNPEEAGRRKLS